MTHAVRRILRAALAWSALAWGALAGAGALAAEGDVTAPAMASATERLGADSVLPSRITLDAVRRACDHTGGAVLTTCFVQELQRQGAPPAAVAMAQRLDQPAVVRQFIAVGPVDVVHVDLPYRANENRAVFLVNGTPATIDVDDHALLPHTALPGDATYAAIARMIPEPTLWPAARIAGLHPNVERRADGGRRFAVPYRVRDRCHACAVVGTAWFAFDFDAQGAFAGASLIGVTAAAPPVGVPPTTPPEQRIVAAVGTEIAITLVSNGTTGYTWTVESPLDTTKVRAISTQYHAPSTRIIGASGLQTWTFSALGEGRAEIRLGYRRSWETSPASEIRRFTVDIRRP